MENNVDFKFKTYDFNKNSGYGSNVINHYNEIISEYFTVLKAKKIPKFVIFSLCENSWTRESDYKHANKENFPIFEALHYNPSFQIALGWDTTTVEKDEDDEEEELYEDKCFNPIASFNMYPQNNCCGAMTCSGATMSFEYQDNKLGEILQYLKEDIAKSLNVSLLTCTDIFSTKETEDTDLSTLKPYLPNTKLLLKRGWEVSKLFYNRKSYNVVGVFTKNIPNIGEPFKEVTLNISLNKNNNLLSKIEDITIGCDPELFLRDKESGEFVPSFFVMKGDKNNPTNITDEGHNIQCDNVMVEYGIPPCKTAEEFVKNNLIAQDYIKDKVAEPNGLEMVIFPSAKFTKGNLKDVKAKHFGCDPDYNAWLNGKPNVVGGTKGDIRCAGGHIHIGYKNHNYTTNMALVKQLDLYLSVPLVLMEPDNDRKTMYGKAGAFRHQPWGVEYRVSSNYIFSSPELMTWAFNQVQLAITKVGQGYLSQLIVDCINNKDKKQAERLIRDYSLVLPNVNLITT